MPTVEPKDAPIFHGDNISPENASPQQTPSRPASWNETDLVATQQGPQPLIQETRGSGWDTEPLFQQHSTRVDVNLDPRLYTDAQFESDYGIRQLRTSRDAADAWSLYGPQEPTTIGQPATLYSLESPELTQSTSFPFPTLHISEYRDLAIGSTQADQQLEVQYQSPITSEYAPSENFPTRTSTRIRASRDESLPSTQAGTHTIENLKPEAAEGEDHERTILFYSGNGAWRCAICSKSFRRRKRAILHVLNKHNNMRVECKGACGSVDWYVENATHPLYRTINILLWVSAP
ncbi:hypothetical protein FRC17_009687 [Serendipita sp. 399]|nr:hypothetical protein FRC17_009687 [Serendipita sp. 399]